MQTSSYRQLWCILVFLRKERLATHRKTFFASFVFAAKFFATAIGLKTKPKPYSGYRMSRRYLPMSEGDH